MRFSIIFFLLFISLTSFAQSDREFKKLFSDYADVMSGQKPQIVNDVFSEKFLKDAGGKETFLTKIKASTDKSKIDLSKLKWRKGKSGTYYFVKLDPASTSDFVVKKENGKIKIDQTLSDSN